jgi:hypothetical protein
MDKNLWLGVWNYLQFLGQKPLKNPARNFLLHLALKFLLFQI